MAAAALIAVECLSFAPQSQRATAIFAALQKGAPAAGVACVPTEKYQGTSPWLMVWGPGATDRFAPMRQHVAQGGRVVALDLAYWDRHVKFRVSIDAAHPQGWVMRRDWPTARLTADRIVSESAWRADGPIVVAGIGEKARAQYGSAVEQWEARQAAVCRSRTSRPVLYRPKKQGSVPSWAQPAATGPIERALRGASLVITWHSNVAVDAIRLGIPVICQDGAAAAVCASEWPAFGDPQPLPVSVRDRFLANLAWFQWAPAEATACWTFLRELLS